MTVMFEQIAGRGRTDGPQNLDVHECKAAELDIGAGV